jgi:STE24 endopeptidase
LNEDRSTRYHRLQRRTAWLGLVTQLAGGLALVGAGLSIPLRDAAVRITGAPSQAVTTVIAYAALLFVLAEVISLPARFYRTFILERRYGLSAAPIRTWIRDHLKAFAIGVVIALAAAAGVYGAMAAWPRWWWAVSAFGFIAAMLLLARIAPVLLMPLFYRFKPLDREVLRGRLETLSARAGLPVLGVYEWGLGERTTRANAALVGTGRSRRILLSDTLLTDYSDDEIEVILAHELGHHANRDIRTGLLIEAGMITFSMGAAAAALHALWKPLGLDGPADVAGLPLLLLVAGLVSLAARPALNALSRRNEHRADRFALELTDRPDAFVSAMRRLASQNLAEAQPSAAALWLFHTHPPFEQRIQAAKSGHGIHG